MRKHEHTVGTRVFLVDRFPERRGKVERVLEHGSSEWFNSGWRDYYVRLDTGHGVYVSHDDLLNKYEARKLVN